MLGTFAAPIELRTPRVLLRQWKPSDQDAWAAINANPAVRRHFPSILSPADAQGETDRIAAAITQRGWGQWALEVPGVHAFAGFFELSVPGFEAPWMPAVEIGWRLAPAAWHRGYASPARRSRLAFAPPISAPYCVDAMARARCSPATMLLKAYPADGVRASLQSLPVNDTSPTLLLPHRRRAIVAHIDFFSAGPIQWCGGKQQEDGELMLPTPTQCTSEKPQKNWLALA